MLWSENSTDTEYLYFGEIEGERGHRDRPLPTHKCNTRSSFDFGCTRMFANMPDLPEWPKRAWRDQHSVFSVFQLASPYSLCHTSQFVQLIRTIGAGLQSGIVLQHQQNNLSPASRDGLAVLGNGHDSDVLPSAVRPIVPRVQKLGERGNRATNIHPIYFNPRAMEYKEPHLWPWLFKGKG